MEADIELLDRQSFDFSKVHLTWISPNLRKVLYNYNFTPDVKAFYEALRYEYSIDVENKDLQRALKLYQENLKNPNSLMRLAFIYLFQYEKFSLEENVVDGLICLFKCYAYSSAYYTFDNLTSHFTNIDILDIIDAVIEDYNLDEETVVKMIQNKITEYPAEELELRYLVCVVKVYFKKEENDVYDVLNAYESVVKDLQILSEKGHLESTCKLASYYSRKISDDMLKCEDSENKLDTSVNCTSVGTVNAIKEKDEEELKNESLKSNEHYLTAKKYFDMCEKSNYISSYCDYGSFLYKTGNLKKSEEILLLGSKLGCYECINDYYDFKMTTTVDLRGKIQDMDHLLEYSLLCFLTGEITFLFEFIFFYRLLTEKFKVAIKCEFFLRISQEFSILSELLSTCNLLGTFDIKNKLAINSLKILPEDFHEVITAMAYLVYCGYHNDKDDKVKKNEDYRFVESMLKNVVENTEVEQIKRFGSYMLYKNHKKLLKSVLLQDVGSEVIALVENEFKLYEKKMIEFCEKLCNKEYIQDFSESYRHNMGRIYQYGIGTNVNYLKAFSFYFGACQRSFKKLTSNSVISCYKKFQCQEALKNPQFSTEIQKILSDLQEKKNTALSSEETSFCFICFEREKAVTFFPCTHFVCCRVCFEKILSHENNRTCPICRELVISYLFDLTSASF